MTTATATMSRRRLGRLEGAALRGVIVRELVNFSSFWRSSTFSSTVDENVEERQNEEKLTSSRTITPRSAARSSRPRRRRPIANEAVVTRSPLPSEGRTRPRGW